MNEALEREIRRIDAVLSPLIHTGIDVRSPGLRQRLAAESAAMHRAQPLIDAAQREADRLLPEMLRLYIDGDDGEHAGIRTLLAECSSFRWGFGWGIAGRVASAEDARRALALFSMKDGDSDYRDAIVWLDRLCAAMLRLTLPIAALLTEAAQWSSDVPRFQSTASTRQLLLDRAGRFAG